MENRVRVRVCVIVLVTFAFAAMTANGKAENLQRRITTDGIKFANRQRVRLPPPALTASMDSDSQRRALDGIAGGIGWKRFSRDSYVAPIEIDLQYVKDDEGQRVGHLVYVAFVAYCDINTLGDQDRIEEIFGSTTVDPKTDQYSAEELKAEQLAQWRIEGDGNDTKYAAVRLPLLDRILVRGVIASQRDEGEDELTISWIMDPKFNPTTASRPTNRWSKLDTNETESYAYQGAGGYMHVTKLNETKGACLVEATMVIHEPTEWFRGSNLLRSKLPLMIQESVRKFRRRCDETTADKDPRSNGDSGN